MARVLVTGANGFIGSHLAEALVAEGHEVTGLVRRTADLRWIEPLGIRLIYGDVTDLDSLRTAVAGQSIVFHLAGTTKALRLSQFHKVNVEGTDNVAQVCAEETTPPTLLYVSSLAAAGPSPPDRLRTEVDPAQPVSDYGRSKWEAEQAVQRYADRVPTTIVRPPIVLGQRDSMGLDLFKSVARFRLHLVPGWFPKRFSIIHSDDLVQVLLLAAQRGERLAPHGSEDARPDLGYYFAACDEHPTYGQLGRMVAAALGYRRVLVLPIASPVVWMVAACAELAAQICRRPFVFRIDKAREAMAGSWACSSQKAAHELGFSVTTPLAERLRQTAQWYRDQGWL